jgi:putative toxin-antitoxin system antitoxin component (TIGR02293 family)
LRQNIHKFGKNVAMAKKLKKSGSLVVKEPAVLYTTKPRRQSPMAIAPAKNAKVASKKESHEITRWLGGAQLIPSSIKSDFDIINAGSEGISKSSVDALANYLGISRKSMAEDIFDLSVKTLERKAPADKMDKRTSSHALEIAKVMQHAFEVFEDEEKLKRWLNKEHRALNGMKPVALFDTMTGLNMVNDILGRIEEGVYS